jgi:hypothetical protein
MQFPMARRPEVQKNIMTEQEIAELHRRLSFLSSSRNAILGADACHFCQ